MASFGTLIFVAIAVSIVIRWPAVAASVTYKDPNLIQITGTIDNHTLEDFTSIAARIRDWGLVVLDSQGGDVLAALAIGHLVRARSFETDVPNKSACASACIFILAAGIDRGAYGKIGIHRPHYDDAYFVGLTVRSSSKIQST